MKGDFYTLNFYESSKEFVRWTNLSKEDKEKEDIEKNDIGV